MVRRAHLRSCTADACASGELVRGRAGVLDCTWLLRPIILVLVYPLLNWYRSVVTRPTLIYLVYPDIKLYVPEPVGRTISLPHTEIMTSPNSVVLKRGTERCDMQLPQVTTGNLRRVFQVSSNLVIKLHYVIALYQCSASLEVSCAPCISLVPWPLHLQYCDPF